MLDSCSVSSDRVEIVEVETGQSLVAQFLQSMSMGRITFPDVFYVFSTGAISDFLGLLSHEPYFVSVFIATMTFSAILVLISLISCARKRKVDTFRDKPTYMKTKILIFVLLIAAFALCEAGFIKNNSAFIDSLAEGNRKLHSIYTAVLKYVNDVFHELRCVTKESVKNAERIVFGIKNTAKAALVPLFSHTENITSLVNVEQKESEIFVADLRALEGTLHDLIKLTDTFFKEVSPMLTLNVTFSLMDVLKPFREDQHVILDSMMNFRKKFEEASGEFVKADFGKEIKLFKIVLTDLIDNRIARFEPHLRQIVRTIESGAKMIDQLDFEMNKQLHSLKSPDETIFPPSILQHFEIAMCTVISFLTVATFIYACGAFTAAIKCCKHGTSESLGHLTGISISVCGHIVLWSTPVLTLYGASFLGAGFLAENNICVPIRSGDPIFLAKMEKETMTKFHNFSISDSIEKCRNDSSFFDLLDFGEVLKTEEIKIDRNVFASEKSLGGRNTEFSEIQKSITDQYIKIDQAISEIDKNIRKLPKLQLPNMNLDLYQNKAMVMWKLYFRNSEKQFEKFDAQFSNSKGTIKELSVSFQTGKKRVSTELKTIENALVEIPLKIANETIAMVEILYHHFVKHITEDVGRCGVLYNNFQSIEHLVCDKSISEMVNIWICLTFLLPVTGLLFLTGMKVSNALKKAAKMKKPHFLMAFGSGISADEKRFPTLDTVI